MLSIIKNCLYKNAIGANLNALNQTIPSCSIFSSSVLSIYDANKYEEPTHWMDYNKKKFPIQQLGEKRRPAYICHAKFNVKYSPKKMWYVACLVRGMSVDEAIKQLTFLHKKGAAIAKDVILEAQKLAVEQHNVEFKSNLWVAESFCTKGVVIKGLRRHAKARMGEVRYIYCHYYVRLEEGTPPEHYYLPYPQTGKQLLDRWVESMRNRKIPNSL